MSYYNYNPNAPAAPTGGPGTAPYQQHQQAAPSSGNDDLRRRPSAATAGPRPLNSAPQPSTGFYNPAAAPAPSGDWYSAPAPAAPVPTQPAFSNPPQMQPQQSQLQGNVAKPPDSGQLMQMMYNSHGSGSGGVGSSSEELSGFISNPGTGTPSYPAAPLRGPTTSPPMQPIPSSEYEDYSNEPPLLEELGVNVAEIAMKTRAVLLLFSRRAYNTTGTNAGNPTEHLLIDNDDIVGPLAFQFLLAFTLLFTGRVQFGVVYGASVVGFSLMAALVNLLSPSGVSPWKVVSILGYSFLPVNVLAAIKVIVPGLPSRGASGTVAGLLAVAWCTVAATRLFERSCNMRDQRWLVAYPVALFYSCFVLITIF